MIKKCSIHWPSYRAVSCFSGKAANRLPADTPSYIAASAAMSSSS
jgi:hypothetical protein